MAPILCQACGCPTPRKRWQFMCTPHWKALPKPLRDQINATWRAFQNRQSGDHQPMLDYTEARDEARRFMADREGRLDQFAPELPRFQRLYGALDARKNAAGDPQENCGEGS